MNVYPVILCGGAGTRLWPTSRPSRAKQFAPLIGDRSLFQQTVRRVGLLEDFTELIVVTGRGQADTVRSQLHGEGPATLILEPEGRESAPAVAVAAHYVASRDSEGVLVLVASDHHIADSEAFCNEIRTAVETARSGRIVTLGITPTKPTSAYGYIRPVERGAKVSPVAAFVEKPDADLAKTYIEEGCLWNSGNFIATANTLLAEFAKHAADIADGAATALKKAERMTDGFMLSDDFRSIRKLSMDYAVMEHTQHASVVAANLAWSDLGAWDAIYDASPQDRDGNAIIGDVLTSNVTGSYIRNDSGMLIAVSCLDGINVVAEDDTILVSHLNNAQDIKSVVDQLHKRKRPETDIPMPHFTIAGAAQTMSRWLNVSAWPLWWSLGFDLQHGLWRESLTSQGEPTDEPIRARVQGRQTYCYAMAGLMGWSGPWKVALAAGMSAMQQCQNDDGLLHHVMDGQGNAMDNIPHLYDQTFVLMALAAAHSQIGDTEQKALAMLDTIEQKFRYDRKGFREAGDHAFQSNAHMHLFEACLAWIESGDSKRWYQLAEDIVALASKHFIDPQHGFLREFFDADWNPAPGDAGRIVEPGHQFEWCWLLTRWSALSGNDDVLDIARTLFDCGLRGIDLKRGVAVNAMDDKLHQTTQQARFWHQTEWLKAAIALYDLSDGKAREGYHKQAAGAYWAVRKFLFPGNGLWMDKMHEDGSFENEYVPASTFYHIVTMAKQLQDSATASR